MLGLDVSDRASHMPPMRQRPIDHDEGHIGMGSGHNALQLPHTLLEAQP
jgi:hypothetical protein